MDPKDADWWWSIFGHPNREISFGGNRRYYSFTGVDEFRAYLETNRPSELHIGPVYSVPPILKRLFQWRQLVVSNRELVVDIDINDYDDRRTTECGCCETRFCRHCWTSYMNPAIMAIHTLFTEHFGFQNIIWAFSGRRGVHAIVLDTFDWDSEAKNAVIERIKQLPERPRIDVAVSLQPNHLIRAPLSVHPTTGWKGAIFKPSVDYYPL